MWKNKGKIFKDFAISYFVIITFVLLSLSPIYIALIRGEQSRLLQSVQDYAQGKAREFEEKENFLFLNARNAYNDRELQNIYYTNDSFHKTLFYNMSQLQVKLNLYFQNIDDVLGTIIYIPKFDYVLTNQYIFENKQKFYDSIYSEVYGESNWLDELLQSDSNITVIPDSFTDRISASSPNAVINYIYTFPMISDPNIKILILISLDRQAIASQFLLPDLQSQGTVTIKDKKGMILAQSQPDKSTQLSSVSFTSRTRKQISITVEDSYFATQRQAVLQSVMKNIGVTLILSACLALYFSWNRSRPIERILALIRKSNLSANNIGKLKELEHVVVNMAAEIHQCNNTIHELDSIVNNSLLDRLFFGEFEQPKIQDAFIRCYGPIPPDCVAAVFQADPPLLDYGKFKQAVQDEFTALDRPIYVIHEQKGNIYTLLPCFSDLAETMEQVLANLRESKNSTVKAGLSNPISNLDQVKTSSQQALRRLNSGLSIQGVYLFTYTYSSRTFQTPISLESMDLLSRALLTWDIVSMDKTLNNLIEDAKTSNLNTVELRQLFFSLRTIYSTVVNQFILDTKKTNSTIEKELYLPNDLDTYSIESIRTTFSELNTAIYIHQQAHLSEKTQNREMDILAYIEENFKDPGLCASSIADHFHISEKYVYRLVKKHCGKTLNDKLSLIRVQEGIRLLEQTDMNISDIALAIGFTSSNSMYKVFMRVSGIAPSAYRKNKRT